MQCFKQLGDDPWVEITGRYPEGSRVLAKVTNLTDYGCFAEIEEGVEGLVHVSEMDWTNKNVNPSRVVSVGEEVEVMVIEIDEERRRISLGIKQCFPNPWDEFAATHNKGVMNGMDAVCIATGNDWRALEAGAHAYAARSGHYTSLTWWRQT